MQPGAPLLLVLSLLQQETVYASLFTLSKGRTSTSMRFLALRVILEWLQVRGGSRVRLDQAPLAQAPLVPACMAAGALRQTLRSPPPPSCVVGAAVPGRVQQFVYAVED